MIKNLVLQFVGFAVHFMGLATFVLYAGIDDAAGVYCGLLSIGMVLVGAFLLTYPTGKGKRTRYMVAVIVAPFTFFGSFILWGNAGMWPPFVIKLAISLIFAATAPCLIIKYLPDRQ